jgi:hypothetical protein
MACISDITTLLTQWKADTEVFDNDACHSSQKPRILHNVTFAPSSAVAQFTTMKCSSCIPSNCSIAFELSGRGERAGVEHKRDISSRYQTSLYYRRYATDLASC